MFILVLAFLASCDGGTAEAPEGPDARQSPAQAEPTEAAAPGPECVETNELTALDDEWDPGCIVVPGGRLTATNGGKALHSFTIAGAVDVDLRPGTSEEVDVTDAADPDGETFFNCKYHPGMSGFFWVE